MKKSVVVIIFLLLIFLPLAHAVSFNSVLTNFFNKFTGNVVSGSCTKTDGSNSVSNNINIKGTISGVRDDGTSFGPRDDFCYTNGQLIEYRCLIDKVGFNDNYDHIYLTCPAGTVCNLGACVKPSTIQPGPCTESWVCGEWKSCVNREQTRGCVDQNNCGTVINKPVEKQSCSTPAPSCTDSDDGSNYYKKGIVTNVDNVYTDYCFSDEKYKNGLMEYHCTDAPQYQPIGLPYDCPNGCKDGACLKQTTTTEPKVCTQDVKVCPDGSSVSRNSNFNCEFDSCPISTTYPGYYLETDKKEYSENEPIYLTITSSVTPGGNVDVYVMNPNYNEKMIVHSGISIEQKSTVIPISQYKNIFTTSGEYLLLICEAGKECISGVNTNSISVFVNVQSIVPPTTTDCGDNYIIEKAGNKFNLGQALYDIDPSITDTELDLLKKGTLKDDEGSNTGDHDYTQTIYFTNSPTGKLVFENDVSGNRDGRPANTYLKFSSAADRWAWNYTLKITGSAVKVENAADLENNVLTILGKDYKITDVEMNSIPYGNVNKIVLMGGNVLSTILQGSTVGGVTVVDVDEAETKCVVEYQGSTYIIDKGQTKTMSDDLIIGVADVIKSGTNQGMCELAIGAHKLILEDGKMVRVNGEDVDNTYVFISGDPYTPNVIGFKELRISYQPEDDVWLTKGESLKDPIFNAFQINFQGISSHYNDQVTIDLVGDKVRATFKNKNQDIFSDYICYASNGKLNYGYSDLKKMFVKNGDFISDNINGVRNLKGTRFLINFDGLSHIAEINNIDIVSKLITIKILDTGEVYKDLSYIPNSLTTLTSINSKLQITINENTNSITFNNIVNSDPIWYTYYGNEIHFNPDCSIVISEIENSNLELELRGKHTTLNVNPKYDSVSQQIVWSSTGSTALGGQIQLRKINDNSMYDYVGMTQFGGEIKMYQQNDGDLKVSFPAEPISANVLLQSTNCITTQTTTGCNSNLECESQYGADYYCQNQGPGGVNKCLKALPCQSPGSLTTEQINCLSNTFTNLGEKAYICDGDGFSRMPEYVKCTESQTAYIVLHCILNQFPDVTSQVQSCVGEIITIDPSLPIIPTQPTTQCNGCLLNEKCIPYGIRSGLQYCDLSGQLIVQKGDSSYCKNNYECASNLCVADKCISSSLWNKIVQWFVGLFGV